MSYELNGHAITEAQIHEPRVGRWTADVVVDSDVDITGAVTITLGTVALSGTVYRGGLDAGRWSGRVVGGAGGLETSLEPKNYVLTTLATVVADIMSASGETLSDDSEDLSGEARGNWHRTRGLAGHALQAVADDLGVPWRMLRDGTVLLGEDEAVELDSAAEQLVVLAQPDIGSALVAPAQDPVVRPGVLLDGRAVSYVATVVDAGKLRQEVWYDDDAGSLVGRVKGSLLRLIEAAVGRRLTYAYLWPCTVAAQAPDGALELLPDDRQVRGSGMSRVYIRHGQPGYETEVPTGARCMVGFEGGDPSRPYVAQWLAGTGVDTITFDGGTEDVARTNDSINVGTITATDSMLAPVTFLYTPPGAPQQPPTTTLLLDDGIITSGNPKLKA